MAKFPTFGKAKFLARKLKLCGEAKAAEDFEAMRKHAEEGLQGIPEAKAAKFVDQRRNLLLALAEAAYRLGDTETASNSVSEAIDLSDGHREFVLVLTDIAERAGEEIIPLLKKGITTSKNDINLLKLLARIYEKTGRVDVEADRLYRMVLDKAPEFPPALLGVAHTTLALKRFDKDLLTHLRRAFRIAPKEKDTLLALAQTYAVMSEPPEESIGVLRTALKEFPDDKLIFGGLTKIYSAQPGYDEEMVRHLKEAFNRKPEKGIADKLLPFLLRERSIDDVSHKVYEVSWRDHDEKTTMLTFLSEAYRKKGRRDETAVRVFEELFKVFPHLKQNTSYLAEVYAEQAMLDRTAEIIYERTFNDDPINVHPNVVKQLSRCFLNSGREDDVARAVFHKQLANSPDDVEVMIALGEMAMGKEHLSGDEAKLLRGLFTNSGVQWKLREDIARRLGEHLAISGAGDNEAVVVYEFNYEHGIATEAEENLLASHYARKNIAEARMRRLYESVYNRTGDEDVLQVLTNIYVDLKEVDDQAIDIFIAHLTRHPTDKTVLGLVCPYLLKKRSNDPKTYPFIVEALKRDPKLEFIGMKPKEVNSALTFIGRHFLKMRQFPLALELFKVAYGRDDDPIVQYLLGVSYFANGDLRTAASIFDDLLKKNPGNPIYAYRVAAVEMARGDTAVAQEGLDILKAQYPGHPLALLRLGMLAELEGKDEAALEYYSQVQSTNPELAALAKSRRGIVLLRLKRTTEAIEVLEGARKELGEDENLAHALGGAYAMKVLEALDAEAVGTAVQAFANMLSLGLKEISFNKMLGLLGYLVNLKQLVSGNAKGALDGVQAVLEAYTEEPGSLFLGGLIEHFNRRYKSAQKYIDRALDLGRRLGGLEPSVRLIAALNLVRLGKYFDCNDHIEWLYAHKRRIEDAFIIRIISFYLNQQETGFPSFLKAQDYSSLMVKHKLSLGFIGSLFLKGGEFATGIDFFEKAFKHLERDQDKLEADFFLGLFNIKAHKEKVGLHHWRNIQDLKDTGDLLPDILNQINLSLFLHFLDHYFISEAQGALARIKPSGEIDLEVAQLYLQLQKGYLEAKGSNLESACREWEYALAIFPSNWMLNQNLALAKTLLGKEEEAASHFNILIHELEKGGEQVFGPVYNFLFEESRKIYNHLISFRSGVIQQIEAKRDIIRDNIMSANKAYWSLNLRKGDGFKEAEMHYFRLVKIYNPERYPDEFKEIESAYAFFKKEGHLKKNEQLVYNSFDLKRFIEMGSKFVRSEIPEFPSVRKFINDFTRPARFFDLGEELKQAREAVSDLNPEIPGPEYVINDWLMDW